MLKAGLANKWTLFLCLFWCHAVFSQNGLQSILVKHPFQTLTARTSYQNMYQDQKGWFYVATSDGIIMYDGINEWFIQHSEVIAEHHISAIAEVSDGVLLMASYDGNIYMINDREFSDWKPKNFPINVAISKIVIDQLNNVSLK
ncbi:MAG: hypothetical protein IPK91_14055 [Saprospiraceae bacterium]|nr:hypothetical protein [Saprospiraceae bacterium]